MDEHETTPVTNPEPAVTGPETTPTPEVVQPVPEPMPTLPQLALTLGVLVLIFTFSYLPFGKRQKETMAPETPPAGEQVSAEAHTEPFAEISITAKAAYVWDVREQRALYSKNASARLPLASLTKLMTALVAEDTLGADVRVVITPQAILAEGDSQLTPGESFSARDLASFMLTTSSNDGAYALAAAAGAALTPTPAAGAAGVGASFVFAMNKKAEQIGLLYTSFGNPTGLDFDDEESGGYGSARDMAFLMEYLIRHNPDLLTETRASASAIASAEGTIRGVRNTNEIAGTIPGLLASKTGFTNLAGGNLVIAYDAGLNRPIIIVVLDSTRDGRFSDVATLVRAASRSLATP